MKNTTAEKHDLFRQQAGWILRKPPQYVSREEREWLPWAQRRVEVLARGALPCPAGTGGGGGLPFPAMINPNTNL